MLGSFKKRKRLRTHGFLARTETVGGRKVLAARRSKGRWELTPSYKVRYKFTNGKSKMHIVAGGTARVIRPHGTNIKLRTVI